MINFLVCLLNEASKGLNPTSGKLTFLIFLSLFHLKLLYCSVLANGEGNFMSDRVAESELTK